MADSRRVQTDFDEIALLPGGFDHNAYYHEFLLRALPLRMDEALDLGCGTGQFSRLLAARTGRVICLDFATNMIAIARRESAAFPNIDFLQTDALSWEWPVDRLDAIVSIATLHHLPTEAVLGKMKAALRPGGTLAVLDLRRSASRGGRLLQGAVALPWSVLLNLRHTGRVRPEHEVRRAWAEHGKGDRYLSIDEVREVCRSVLPGARIRRHLLWRYSLIWRKSLEKC